MSSKINLLKILCYNIYINQSCGYSFTYLQQLLIEGNVDKSKIVIQQLFSNIPFHLLTIDGINYIQDLNKKLESIDDIHDLLEQLYNIILSNKINDSTYDSAYDSTYDSAYDSAYDSTYGLDKDKECPPIPPEKECPPIPPEKECPPCEIYKDSDKKAKTNETMENKIQEMISESKVDEEDIEDKREKNDEEGKEGKEANDKTNEEDKEGTIQRYIVGEKKLSTRDSATRDSAKISSKSHQRSKHYNPTTKPVTKKIIYRATEPGYNIKSSDTIDDDLLDEYYQKPLFSKGHIDTISNIQQMTIDEVLQLLHLPTINNKEQITLHKETLIHTTYNDEQFNDLLNQIVNQVTSVDKDIILGCLDYYKGIITKQMITTKLKRHNIRTVILTLYRIHKILIDKGYISKISFIEPSLNTNQYSITDALQLLSLPAIDKQYHVLFSKSDIIDISELDGAKPKFNKMSKNEIDILNKCIDYYQGIYPLQKISQDLLTYPYKLTNMVQFLYKYQNIYIKKVKEVISPTQYSLKEALRLLKLPSITSSNTLIKLSKTKITKSSLKSHELELVELCEDYYNHFYPRELLKGNLQEYPYNLQPVLQYLYNKI